MLIAEEEIRYVPPYRPILKSAGHVVTYIWQHTLSLRQLLEFIHIHYPLLQADCTGMGDKRKIERLSVAVILCQLLGVKAQIGHLPNGEPFILGENTLKISISHSGHIYALSLSTHPHGMDVEQWGEKALQVRHKFLHPDEELLLTCYYPALHTTERTATMLWSAKEAAFKAFNIPHLFVTDISLQFLDANTLLASTPNHSQSLTIRFSPYPSVVHTLAIL